MVFNSNLRARGYDNSNRVDGGFKGLLRDSEEVQR